MKKKVLSAALVVALLAIMVGGTLAYFTAEDEVANTFTIGSVKIEIWENDKVAAEVVQPIGTLLPIVNTKDPSVDANYIKKEVSVENTGANSAYVRTHIAIPAQLMGYIVLDTLDTKENNNWNYINMSSATVGGVNYVVFSYDYNKELGVGETTDKLLNGVYLDEDVDLKEDADGNLVFCMRKADGSYDYSGYIAHPADGSESQLVSVLVASEAIQADGFATASEALNTGFGVGTNPWQQP